MGILRFPHKRYAVLAGVAAPLLVVLAACSASRSAPTATPVPTSAQLNEHASLGQVKYTTAGCAACHGARGEGGIAPRTSGTAMRLEELQRLVRSNTMDGVQYADDELTDRDVANIYLWLQTNPAG
ncbi:MAG: cytochrome c [Thermomicrobia bacterium]|nr:cytochrome c [Thermomicrobia bacterium]